MFSKMILFGFFAVTVVLSVCVQSSRVLSYSTITDYMYIVVSMGESYTITIKTDGVISGLSYNNYSFHINWETYGTFENVTVPRSLNGSRISVVYSDMTQGWDQSPMVVANETHYTILGPDPQGFGHIEEVYFGAPTVHVDVNTPTTYLGYYVNITGIVSYRGKPVNDVLVRLAWSSGGVPNEIQTLAPSVDGTFIASWIPTATGTYYIVAAVLIHPWPDEVPKPQVYACLSISPPYGQNVFTVMSNSTITNLIFDSENYILSFSASGPDGTTGYAKVFISKQLLTDISALKVYVDKNLTSYTYTSTTDAWIIIVRYTHSTHQIEMVIPEFPPYIAFIIMIFASSALFIKKHRPPLIF